MMEITRVKINGMENPRGYRFRKAKVSWNVEGTTGKCQKNVKIEVALDADFANVVYTKEGADLKPYNEVLDLELTARTTYFCRITVTADNEDVAVSAPAMFETGKMDEAWEASWICTEKEDQFHPVFFKDFKAVGEIVRGRIYVTGLGLYEAYMNGEKIGDETLAPFFNDYAKDVQYQTYDITAALKADNRIEIFLGNGWYKGQFGFMGQGEIYGHYMTTIAEIHVDYADGRHEVIKTDDTWKYRGSDIEDSGIYNGEIINRQLWKGKENPEKSACLTMDVYPEDVNKYHLSERFSVPVRVCETLAVKEVIHTPAGETVLDMGQNFAGYVAFNADLPEGSRVCLQYGEVLQHDNFYNDNYRGAIGGLTYVSDGKPEYVRAHFTFFGGRYVRVSGWPQNVVLDPADFTGCVVHSDLERTGFIETSDKDVNQLISNCLWGQRSNFIDVPTDCPQRNERMGWTGDAQVFSPTASYNMDTRAFFDKYMYDLRVAQHDLGGSVPHVAPMAGMIAGGSSVWADIATFLPTTMYEYYGDTETLENYYPLMKDWVDWITKGDEERGATHLFDFVFTFGDWLALDGMTEQSVKGGTDDAYVSSCYYYASTKKVADAAAVLGKTEDAEKYNALAEKIKNAIFNEYFSGSGRLCIDAQTAYMIALKFGLYTNKEKLTAGLANRFRKDAHKIKGGFVGATMMCRVLAENGFEDEAWHMLFNHEFPGWLHCVDLGATTVWERWNSLLDDGSISGTGMNSLNHYAYGSVVEYIYRNIAGIAPAAPGFSAVTFKPLVNWRMKYINCTYKSVSGTYVSNWKLNADGTVSMHFEVPFGCRATAVLPEYDGDVLALEAGSHDITYMPKKDFRAMFSMDSRLAELAANEKALAILKEKCPRAYHVIMENDIEQMNLTLKEFQGRDTMGIAPEALAAVGREVSRILAE